MNSKENSTYSFQIVIPAIKQVSIELIQLFIIKFDRELS